MRLRSRASAALLGVLALASCQAQRLLRITSDPSQAEVRLDGQLVGSTPCEVPFLHYGTRRVTLYLEGYRTYSRVVEVRAPWYGRFPLDIVTEVLVPLGWRDVHGIHVTLAPGQSALLEPDFPSVLERAETLRRAGPEGPRPSQRAGASGRGDARP
jgi:hypothetical protein